MHSLCKKGNSMFSNPDFKGQWPALLIAFYLLFFFVEYIQFSFTGFSLLFFADYRSGLDSANLGEASYVLLPFGSIVLFFPLRTIYYRAKKRIIDGLVHPYIAILQFIITFLLYGIAFCIALNVGTLGRRFTTNFFL